MGKKSLKPSPEPPTIETDENAGGVATLDIPGWLAASRRAKAPASALLSLATVETLAEQGRGVVLGEQADTWIEDTIVALENERDDAATDEGARREINADLEILNGEAERRREAADGKVCAAEEAEAPAADAAVDGTNPSVDGTNPPITEREAASAELSDSHIDAVMDRVASDVARDIRESGATIGVAAELPGRPSVTDLIVELQIDDIMADPEQPRLDVDTELTESIAAEGVKQPIVVRRNPLGLESTKRYMIVDGERRWRASSHALLPTIPARVTEQAEDAGDRLLLQVTLNEGKRLAPMEEAKAWKRIMDAKSWNIKELATALGRAKSTVSDRLAMLDAPAPFQELLKSGVLTAAAAPIVREYRDVPERILKQLVDGAMKFAWSEAIEAGVAVPLKLVEEGLQDEIDQADELQPMDDESVAAEYSGPTCTIKGEKYATDTKAWDAIAAAHVNSKGPARASAPQKREPDPYQKKQREEAKKAHAKSDLRRDQARAIAAKLPVRLDAPWARFLVKYLLSEMTTDSQRFAVRILGIDPPKMGTQGYQFDKAILQHAASMKVEQLVALTLTLLMAQDLYVSPNSTSHPAPRITEAAQLLKLDLSKVRSPDPDAKAPAASPAKTAVKAKPRTPAKSAAKKKPASVKSKKTAKARKR